jgi:biotin operon repressor
MNAMLEPVAFALPKKPRIIEKEALPDQRRLAVIPIRACTDSTLTLGMMRALVLICSYANRSGITWVSQKALADKLGVTQQAISKHLVKLTKAKYIEVLKRPVPGYSHTTWRVIYDPSVSAEDAVSITSAIEDTRAPYMKEQQMREQEEVDREGQRRVAQAISKALKQQPKRTNTMPKHDATRTVKEMKQGAQKSRPKGTHAQPLKVVPQSQPQPVDNFPLAQPNDVGGTTIQGCTERGEHSYKELVVNKVNLNTVLNNFEVEGLIQEGIDIEAIKQGLETLLPLYQSEGITPTSATLMAGIRQLQADAS